MKNPTCRLHSEFLNPDLIDKHEGPEYIPASDSSLATVTSGGL